MTDNAIRNPWRLAGWALVKTTGFPYELLESLRSPDLDRAVDTDDAQGIEKTIAESVERLVALCADDAFQEAVLLSSRTAYEQLRRWVAGNPDAGALRSDDRRKVHLAAMYLQRFCAKNESTSFFGPVYWASLRGDATVLDPGTSTEPFRQTFWTHWAAQALADAMSSDPQVLGAVTPARPPGLVARDGHFRAVRYLDGLPSVVDVPAPRTDLERRIHARCDGGTRSADIARAEGIPLETVRAALTELECQGLIDFRLRVPFGLIDPLRPLRAFLRGLAEPARSRWLRVLNEMEAATAAVNRARGPTDRETSLRALGNSFTAVTGRAPEKDAGRHYTDRSILVEDGALPWHRFDIGGSFHEYLRDEFPPIMDLLFELPLARRRRRVDLITAWFDGTFGARAVPLDTVLSEAHTAGLAQRLRAADDEVLASGPSALTDLLLANTHCSRIERGHNWTRQQAERVDFDTWCIAGADLLLAAPDLHAVNEGRYEVVVGELHGLHDQLLQGLWPALHPNPAELAANVGGLIAGLTDGVVCEPVLGHWRKTHARAEVLPEIEFHGRSPRPSDRKTTAAELFVRLAAGQLTLNSPSHGRVYLTRPPLRSWGDETETVFAPFTGARIVGADDILRPVNGNGHLPRLTLGRTVVHRETWHLPPPERVAWRSLSVASQTRIRRLGQQYGLPRQVYAKFPGEPKPIFVDFDVPVLVDLFARRYARTTVPVAVSEMLPGPDHLWLSGPGGRHTSELRFGYYRQQPRRPGSMGERHEPRTDL